MKNYENVIVSKRKYQFSGNKNLNIKITSSLNFEIVFEDFCGDVIFEFQNSETYLNLMFKKENNINFKLNLENSNLKINFLNISTTSKINKKIKLDKSKYVATEKTYTKNASLNKTKIYHLTANTISDVTCLGIGDGKSHFNFDIETKINKNCDNVSVNQDLKVIALTDLVSADLSPILKINHYNITGSHAAVFKRINQEDLYYLLTRGLSIKEAKNLIVKGNLLINNEKYYQEIEAIL